MVFRAAAPPGLAGLIRPAPVDSGSLLPWEARARRRWGHVCFRAPGPGADQTKSMADASIYRVLLSLVVNLELMDDVEEKK